MRILVIQHDDDTPLGSLEEPLRESGALIERWRAQREPTPPRPLSAYSGVIVLGGITHPDQDDERPWLTGERATIRAAVERGIPTLGICLGGQLLAQAAGGSAAAAVDVEVGWKRVELTPEAADDVVFGGFPHRFETFEWHYYRFALPAGAVLLARNEAAPQAYRVGQRAWGTQFHIEAPAATISEWLTVAGEEARSKGADPEAEIAATRAKDAAHVALAQELARRFGSVVADYAGSRNAASPARTS
jgi:GMP synthase (glutamine-hydrolysing)